MRSLRSSFIISHLLPVLVVVPLVGLILIYLLETQIILTQMSEDISDKAHLIAETVNGRPELLRDLRGHRIPAETGLTPGSRSRPMDELRVENAHTTAGPRGRP